MKLKFFNTAFIILIFGLTTSVGQSRYSSYNQSLIDTEKKYVQQYCTNFGSSKPISKKRIKYDKNRIAFLNAFYNKDLTPKEIHEQMGKFYKHKWGFDTTKLGAVTKYETRIYSGGNLEMFISFSTFEENIVFKRIYFNTRTLTNCIQPYQIGISQHDFKYLESTIIPIADFPFSYCGHCSYISCDTVFLDKLRGASPSEYQLFLSSADNDLNNMTWFRIDKYMMDYVVNDIAKIVKESNKELLFKLLYSPNHILSLYSMEGLTYLNETRQIEIPINIQQKMEEIKNSDTKIIWQYSDVVRRGLTYKDLKIDKQKILAKFKRT